MTNRNNHRLAFAVSAHCLAQIAALRKAVHYVCAAHRDQQNHFPYAAALEWRKAAELFSSNKQVAEYCWRQWERIVQLPRRLACPISDSSGSAPAGGGAFVLDPAGADNANCWCAPDVTQRRQVLYQQLCHDDLRDQDHRKHCSISNVRCIGIGFARRVSQAGRLCLDAGNQTHERCKGDFEQLISHDHGHLCNHQRNSRPR
jgi:hypothetical protein